MKRRIFIALPLTPEALHELQGKLEKVSLPSGPNVGMVKEDNWHSTLLFLGDQDDESVSTTVTVMEEIMKEATLPILEFQKVLYGPVKGRQEPATHPRMIWLLGSRESSEVVGTLHDKLENDLLDAGIRFRPERRLFQLHLTLARLKGEVNPKTFEEPLSLSYEPEAIELMESTLRPQGSEYHTLARFEFQGR